MFEIQKEIEALKERVAALESIAGLRTPAAEWNAVFNSYLGTRCVPAERALLAERWPTVEALRAELEARADIDSGVVMVLRLGDEKDLTEGELKTLEGQ